MKRLGPAALLFAGLLTAGAAQADDKECMAAASKGQQLRDEGHLTEARALFQQCAQATCPAPIPKYCADWLAETTRKTPSIVVRVVDENDRDITDASTTIDNKPVTLDGRAVEVDPGKHHIRITRQGRKTFESDVLVAQSEKDRIIVGKLAPDVAEPLTPPPSTRGGVPIVSWVGWGIGAVGLASFIGFGLKASSDYDSFESTCGTRCSTADRDSVSSSVTIADVSLVIGLVAAGVGTYFYLTRPHAPPRTAGSLR